MIKTNSKEIKVESAQEKDGSITIKISNTPFISTNQVSSNNDIPDFELDKISQEDTAKMFDVTVQTIINWKKRGLIKQYKIGHPVFFRRSELLQAASTNRLLQKA